MKSFFLEWFKLMAISCLFLVALAIIVIPTIIADKFINDNSVSALFTFYWGFLSSTFLTTIAIREVKKKNK